MDAVTGQSIAVQVGAQTVSAGALITGFALALYKIADKVGPLLLDKFMASRRELELLRHDRIEKELQIAQLEKAKNDDAVKALERLLNVNTEDQRALKSAFLLHQQEMLQVRQDIRENTAAVGLLKNALRHTDKSVADLTAEIIADRPLLEEVAGIFRKIKAKHEQAGAVEEESATASQSESAVPREKEPPSGLQATPPVTHPAGVPIPRGPEPVAPYRKVWKGDMLHFQHTPPKKGEGEE